MDLTWSPLYEVIFINQIVMKYVLTLALIPFDLLLYDIGNIIVVNLKSIKNRFVVCLKTKNMRELGVVVTAHNKVLDCFNKFNKLYAPILLTKLLSIALLICLLGFHVTMVIFGIFRIF